MFGLYNITTFNSCEDSTDWGKITPKAIKTQGLESFNIGTHRNPSKKSDALVFTSGKFNSIQDVSPLLTFCHISYLKAQDHFQCDSLA